MPHLAESLFCAALLVGASMAAERRPLHRAADLDKGESAAVEFAGGGSARVTLHEVTEERDTLRDGLRRAVARITVNGSAARLECGNYNLPVEVGGVQVDCPATSGLIRDGRRNSWGLKKAARLRLWPKGSPWIEPGSFRYPAGQRWFASMTQMSNELCYVDGSDLPGARSYYYHNDLDFGGAEGLVRVIAATDGLVVSRGEVQLPGYDATPVSKRYDVVYLLDDRGWYYRYSHLFSIDASIQPGRRVKMGDQIGLLGKEGASGGWSHLHFGITSRQPSGEWGTEEAYAFAWEAWQREHPTPLVAVARPHSLAAVGEAVQLDGSRSWSAGGRVAKYEWTLSNGKRVEGAKTTMRYSKPGQYSEILKVTDPEGRVSYDFLVVQIVDPARPDQLPPTLHAAYAPSLKVPAGQPVTFKTRTFRTTEGSEAWHFGDGSPPVTVRSDGCVKPLAKDGYAVTEHAFAKAGDYIVRVERANSRGERAVAHLWVKVER